MANSVGSLALTVTADAGQLTAGLAKATVQVAGFAARSAAAMAGFAARSAAAALSVSKSLAGLGLSGTLGTGRLALSGAGGLATGGARLLRSGALAAAHVNENGLTPGGLASGLSGALDVLGSVPKVGPMLVVLKDAVFALVGPALDAAGGAQRMKLQFDALFGTAEEGASALEKLRDLVHASGTSLSDLVPATRDLAAAGLAADQVVPAVRALAAVASATGEPLERLSGSLAHVIETGHVSEKTMRSLGGPVLGRLRDSLGLAGQDLHRAFAEGRVSARDVLKALSDLTNEGGRFGDVLARQAQSAQGRLNGLTASVKETFVALGQTAGKGLSEGFGGLGDSSAFFADVQAGVRNLEPAFRAVGEAARAMWAFTKKAWEDFGRPAFDAAREALAGWGQGWVSGTDVVLGALEAVGKGIAYAVEALRWFGGAVVEYAVAPAVGGFALMLDGVVYFLEGVKRMAQVAAPALFGLAVAGGAFYVAFKWTIDTLAPLFTRFLDWLNASFVRPAILQFGTLVTAVLDLTRPLIAFLGDAAPEWLSKMSDSVEETWGRIKTNDLSRQLGRPFEDAQDAVEGFRKKVEGVHDQVGDLGKKMRADVRFGQGADAVQGWFGNLRAELNAVRADLAAPGAHADLAAGFKDVVRPSDLHGVGALEQGSKEAYSAVLKYQMGGGLDGARREEIERQKEMVERLKKQNQLQQELLNNGRLLYNKLVDFQIFKV